MDKNLKIAVILAAQDKATAILSNAFSKAEKQARSFERVGQSVSAIGTGSLIAGTAVAAFLGKTISDARESEIANRRLERVFRSMGQTTDDLAKKAEAFAGDYQMQIGVEDEDIMAVQAKFATFSKTMTAGAQRIDAFNRATKAAFDLQAAGFGDASNNAVQLGKALQDPVRGAMALSRVGAFNRGDIPILKQIQATKGLAAAQDYVLKAVEKQVSGVAKATADPIKIMQKQFSETSEAIGKQLLPEVSKLADKIASFLPKVISFVENNKGLVLSIGKGAVALLAFGGTMKVLGFIMSGFSTAFKLGGAIIKGFGYAVQLSGTIATLAVKGYEAVKFALFALQYQLKFSIVPALQRAGVAFMEFGATLLANPITWYVAAAVALGAAAYFIIKNWDKVSAFFSRLWVGIKNAFSKGWQGIKGLLLNFTPGGLIIKHWQPIAGMFTNIWENVKNVFTGVWKWVTGLGAKFFDAGKNIVASVWNGMKAMAAKPVELIANITKKIRDHLPFSPAKAGALRDIHRIKLVETVAQSIRPRPLLAAWENATNSLYQQMNRPAPQMAGGGNSQIHFSPTIHINGSASKSDVESAMNNSYSEFQRLMRKYEADKSRRSF